MFSINYSQNAFSFNALLTMQQLAIVCVKLRLLYLIKCHSGVTHKQIQVTILQWMCSMLCKAILHCVLIKLLGDTFPRPGVNEPPQLSTVVTFKATRLCLGEDKMK